jgi:hypothetical protein
MPVPPYRFHYGEPTLSEGFDCEKVREHLKKRRDEVREFLADHHEHCRYTAAQAENLSPSYNGYSLYELDGVFRGRENKLDEERVQIIRLMFLPPTERLERVASKEKRQLAARRYMHFWTQNFDEYRKDLKFCKRPSAERKIARILNTWLKDVGLFLHGYILFKLCEKIDKLSKGKSIAKAEDEIWLTAFRGLAVVRTIHK